MRDILTISIITSFIVILFFYFPEDKKENTFQCPAYIEENSPVTGRLEQHLCEPTAAGSCFCTAPVSLDQSESKIYTFAGK